jgi:hypothetical protein
MRATLVGALALVLGLLSSRPALAVDGSPGVTPHDGAVAAGNQNAFVSLGLVMNGAATAAQTYCLVTDRDLCASVAAAHLVTAPVMIAAWVAFENRGGATQGLGLVTVWSVGLAALDLWRLLRHDKPSTLGREVYQGGHDEIYILPPAPAASFELAPTMIGADGFGVGASGSF